MKIIYQLGIIDKKISEYLMRNYVLNKRCFSFKSIMLIIDYFYIFININNYMD